MSRALIRRCLMLYLLFLGAYLAASGPRLRRPSSDVHFVYLAKMWLEGRIDLGHAPPNSNDWAEVEYLTLKDGRTLAGTFLRANPNRFRTLEGKLETIAPDQIDKRDKKYYVSFPPFPAVLFLPFVALAGLRVNDVALTCVLAALGPMLLFLILRRLSARGDSNRSESDDLWLTALFGVGSVYFYASVLGQVWYTAHVVSVALASLFVLASFEVRRPVMAGVLLGALVLTRPQMGFFGVFFLYELWRAKKPIVPALVKVGLPVLAFAAVGAWFNWVRFHSLTEFGHFYLNVRWTPRIQRYGLFNYAFLPRNLAAAFTLLPKLLPGRPWVQIPWHGLSLFLTTPALLYLLWPHKKGHLHRGLWLAAAPIALLGFLYQNDGWVQFGFRFSLDYMVLLVMLLAAGNRPLTRTFKLVIVAGVLVNLFGAITFGRAWQFYYDGFFPIGLTDL